MKKFVFIFLMMFLVYFYIAPPVNAQVTVKSNSWTTKVGKPTNPASCGDILGWAAQLASNLQNHGVVFSSYFNVMNQIFSSCGYNSQKWPNTVLLSNTNPGGNLFWCTYLVINSYNLAGISGLTLSQAGVINMEDYFEKQITPYRYLPYDNPSYSNTNKQSTLQSIKPGYAMFIEDSPGKYTGEEHVGVVKEIGINPAGDGKITTYESNSSHTSQTYTVSDWVVLNLPHHYLTGFGGAQ